MRVLIAYATSHGSTAEIATRIAGVLRMSGVDVLVSDVRALPRTLDAARFDAILVGGRVWGSGYPRRLLRFVRRHRRALESRPSAFFSVCLWNVSRLVEHRNAARDVPLRFLTRAKWLPDRVEIIAGTLAFTKYRGGALGRRLMRAVWRADLGDLDTARDHCFTDWAQVDAFANAFLFAAQPVEHALS